MLQNLFHHHLRTSTSSHALLDEYTQQSGIARLSTSMQINTYFLDYIILVISCAWAVVASITSRSRSYVQRSRLHPALPMKPSSFQAIKPSSFQAFKLSLRAFDLVGLIGIAKTKTSWKGGMGCKQTAYTHFASISQKKDCKSYSGTAHPSTLQIFFLCTALQTSHQYTNRSMHTYKSCHIIYTTSCI